MGARKIIVCCARGGRVGQGFQQIGGIVNPSRRTAGRARSPASITQLRIIGPVVRGAWRGLDNAVHANACIFAASGVKREKILLLMTELVVQVRFKSGLVPEMFRDFFLDFFLAAMKFSPNDNNNLIQENRGLIQVTFL